MKRAVYPAIALLFSQCCYSIIPLSFPDGETNLKIAKSENINLTALPVKIIIIENDLKNKIGDVEISALESDDALKRNIRGYILKEIKNSKLFRPSETANFTLAIRYKLGRDADYAISNLNRRTLSLLTLGLFPYTAEYPIQFRLYACSKDILVAQINYDFMLRQSISWPLALAVLFSGTMKKKYPAHPGKLRMEDLPESLKLRMRRDLYNARRRLQEALEYSQQNDVEKKIKTPFYYRRTCPAASPANR